MSHLVETMAFAGKVPWHGLGVKVEGAVTAEEMIVKAGLDWSVSPVQAFFRTGNPLDPSSAKFHEADDMRVILRVSDRAVLGMATKHWKPLQNRVAFSEFDKVVSSSQATYETAGSLAGGKKVFILAKLANASGDIVPGDQVDGYFLLANGHDGKTGVTVQFTTIRVVCNNTLSAAMSTNEHRLSFHHKGDVQQTLEGVFTTCDLARKTFAMTLEQYRFLAGRQVKAGNGDGSLDQYFRQVLKLADDADDMPRAFHALKGVWHEQPGRQFGEGSYWHALNTVTRYVDFKRGRDESRLNAAWFGDGAALKQRALFTALEFAKAA